MADPKIRPVIDLNPRVFDRIEAIEDGYSDTISGYEFDAVGRCKDRPVGWKSKQRKKNKAAKKARRRNR